MGKPYNLKLETIHSFEYDNLSLPEQELHKSIKRKNRQIKPRDYGQLWKEDLKSGTPIIGNLLTYHNKGKLPDHFFETLYVYLFLVQEELIRKDRIIDTLLTTSFKE